MNTKAYDSGWKLWGRIKFLWDTFRTIRKNKFFYLITLDDFKKFPDGRFEYKYSRMMHGMELDAWENFLREHFNSVKEQGDLINGYNKILNKESKQ